MVRKLITLFVSMLISACSTLSRQDDCMTNSYVAVGSTSLDGFVVGHKGCVYHPSDVLKTELSSIRVGEVDQEPVVMFVNGAVNSLFRQYQKLVRFSEETQAAFIGIYNGELFPGKIWLPANETHTSAEKTLTELIHHQLERGSAVYLLTGSKGTHIVVNALERVKQQLVTLSLLEKGSATSLMSQINVVTYGGASRIYPDGPAYTHYVNRLDPIPWLFGVGALGAHAGKDAKVVKVIGLGPLEWNPISPVHGFRAYLPYINESIGLRK